MDKPLAAGDRRQQAALKHQSLESRLEPPINLTLHESTAS
jgi:hypothetical protein